MQTPGTMDHYMLATLRVRGYMPLIGRPFRTKPWQEIQRALHAADAACAFVVEHYGQVPTNR